MYNLVYYYKIFALFCQWHWYSPLSTIMISYMYVVTYTYLQKEKKSRNGNSNIGYWKKNFILILICLYVEEELQKCFPCFVAHNRAKWGWKFRICFKGWVYAAVSQNAGGACAGSRSCFAPQHSTGSLWPDGVAVSWATLSITSVTCCDHQSFEETLEAQRFSSSAAPALFWLFIQVQIVHNHRWCSFMRAACIKNLLRVKNAHFKINSVQMSY